MIDLQVTAYLDTPVIGTLSPLDAPLSYAASACPVSSSEWAGAA